LFPPPASNAVERFLFAPARRRGAAAAALAAGLLTAALLSRSGAGVGVTWDEDIHIRYSDGLRAWWDAGRPRTPEVIDRVWHGDLTYNVHPPLPKIASAVTASLFEGRLPFPAEYRLPHALFAGLGAAACAAVLALYGSPALACLGLVLALAQPRVWGDLMLATTDGAVLTVWLTVTLLGWALTEEKGTRARRLLWAALTFFLAAGTGAKVTAFLSFVPLALYWAARRRWPDVARLLAAAALSLALLPLCSPADWHAPFAAVHRFLAQPFLRRNIPISTVYGGVIYPFDLPWHYADVMALTTLPEAVLGGLALLALGRFPGGPFLGAAGAAALFWAVLVHVPGVPRHDGVRQFVSLFPLLGVLSASGFLGALRRCHIPPWAKASAAGAAGLWAAAVLAGVHPLEASYYNAVSGGIAAADRRGMEITYYFDALDRGTLERLNAFLKPGDRVALLPDWPDLLRLYQKKGLLRPDVEVVVPSRDPDVAVVYHRRSLVDEPEYAAFAAPLERTWRGVSLVKIGRVRPPRS
jgi:hypothetical protein